MRWTAASISILSLFSVLFACSGEKAQQTALMWSTFVGQSSTDEGFGIALDDSGNVYVTGFTASVDFPITAGAFDTTFNGGTIDALAIKLDPTGSTLDYATFLGGSGADRAFGIAVDGSGYAYLTGRTQSGDFPTTAGAFDTTHHGDYDLFVVKLAPTGCTLSYATLLGGRDYDKGESIALDPSGNAYVTGWTKSSDFPSTAGAFSTAHHGQEETDAFVAKLNPAGSGLVYATFLGGGDQDWGQDIAVDDSGYVFVGLLTGSDDFPTTGGAFDTTYGGLSDASVVKLDLTGSGLIYATFLGGAGQDWCQGIALDDSGHAYVTGITYSNDFPTTAKAYSTGHGGYCDVFVAKLDPTGTALVYSTLLGGKDEERSTGIALDGSGHACLTGVTRSVDFPTTMGAIDTSYNGKADAFVAQLDPTGGILAYATFLGGSVDEAGQGIAVDGSGHVYLTGWTESADFPTTPEALDRSYNGREDIFVVKMRIGQSSSSR